ncbi:MAG TPA: polyphosphate kinase 1 [Gaiellales bacterium]
MASRTGAPRARRGAPRDDTRLLNREISWVEFNARVLELARDEHVPLLERMRFLAIFSSNLDEFYMVRVAGLLEQARAGTARRPAAGELGIDEVLAEIGERTDSLMHEQSRVLDDLLPELARRGVQIVTMEECDEGERAELSAAFLGVIFPVLTPLAVGPGRPFPYISNLSLSLGVLVRDPLSGDRRFARVKVPEVLPRFWRVGTGGRFLPLEQLIAAHLGSLFPGMEIEESSAFRVTRDADLEIDDQSDDLLQAMETELRRRRFGDVVRLELDARTSPEMREQLVHHLGVTARHVYAIDGLLDCADLTELVSSGPPELLFPEWSGVTPPSLQPAGEGLEPDIFATVRKNDVLVHHPYERFDTSVEAFVRQAVDDPDVLAIKHTIYRTSGDSPMVPMLIRAAEQGKQAVVLVELKARFDEERNIGWARALERAGVHVVYGFVGLKTHAKCALVVRREGGGIRRYVHIGTGNYHPRTARLYTDFGLLTCRPDLAADVADLFNYLTGFARPRRYRKLLVAPLDLRERILAEVTRVVASHTPEHPGRIVMKMNSLVDRQAIEALYEASQAGVRVDLIVRGICCLRPGVAGLSENVRVVSLLGRFLEHERVFQFTDVDGTRTYMGSADLMPRNLDARVEVVTPVEDAHAANEVDVVLTACLNDNRACWELQAGGTWIRVRPADDEDERSAQDEMMARAVEAAERAARAHLADETLERVVRRRGRRSGSDAV